MHGLCCALLVCALFTTTPVNTFAQGKRVVKKQYTNPQPPKAAKFGAKAKPIKRLTPVIPSANRNVTDKVFLENADVLSANENVKDYQVLRGNVKFRRGGMYMYCDSAYFYERTNSLDAFGHVKMTSGDTLRVFSDILHYYGNQHIAELRYNVRVENRGMTLVTDSLDYEIRSNVAYFFNGGRMVDNRGNRLTSEYGRFEMDSKKAEFRNNVKLKNEKYDMTTNVLYYDMRTHVAHIVDHTTILSDGNRIVTEEGYYNTASDAATLYRRSRVTTKDDKFLTGDTIFYDRKRGYGEARGNVEVTDSKNKVILNGGYGYHNENTHLTYATRNPRAREYSNGDTIYLHADTLITYPDSTDDKLHILKALHKARFFRNDLQGVCDSIVFAERDSILNLYHHAILWNTSRQITGEEVNVHLKDSTADWATLPLGGMLVEHVGEDYYDQLVGREMKAYFENKELRQLDVTGNVQAIFYPAEKDSTYNKQVFAESSYLVINLKEKQEIDKMRMWPEVSGRITPLYLLKRANFFLDGFKWHSNLRPQKPEDLFIVSDDLRQLFEAPEVSNVRRRRTVN